MQLTKIKEYWNKMGATFRTDSPSTPTSRDPFLGCLEEEKIFRHLEAEMTVMEVGCGDAAHTVTYAERVKEVYAVDVAETMLERAKETIARTSRENVRFQAGSVLDLDGLLGGRKFDCVVSQRCVINLPDWEHQKQALSQIHGCLRRGGMLLLTEGFQEGLDRINVIRQDVGLSEIRTVDYNCNMRQADFEAYISKSFETIECSGYGAYLFFSRVFHPMAVLPDAPRHDSSLNKAAMKIARVLPADTFKEYSYNLFYALRKK